MDFLAAEFVRWQAIDQKIREVQWLNRASIQMLDDLMLIVRRMRETQSLEVVDSTNEPHVKTYLIGYVEKYSGLTTIVSKVYSDDVENATFIPAITRMIDCMRAVNDILIEEWFPITIISTLEAIGTVTPPPAE